MNLGVAVISAVACYLIGAISFSRIITKLHSPNLNLEDVHLPGQGGQQGIQLKTVGANTAAVALGPRVGCLIGLLDILKGFLPTLALRLIFPEQYYFLLGGLFTVLGHNWPIYYRFRGGAGMSTIYGSLLAVDWPGVFVCAATGMLLGLAIVRDVFVAYVGGLWLIIPWLWLRTQGPCYILYAILVNITFMLALVPEAKPYLELRRKGEVDLSQSMDTTPMGRGIKRMAQAVGFMKDKAGKP